MEAGAGNARKLIVFKGGLGSVLGFKGILTRLHKVKEIVMDKRRREREVILNFIGYDDMEVDF